MSFFVVEMSFPSRLNVGLCCSTRICTHETPPSATSRNGDATSGGCRLSGRRFPSRDQDTNLQFWGISFGILLISQVTGSDLIFLSDVNVNFLCFNTMRKVPLNFFYLMFVTIYYYPNNKICCQS